MLEQMIAYFDTIPSSHRALILAGGITFFLDHRGSDSDV